MGDIRKLPMEFWRTAFELNTFVETGVDQGAAMIAALNRGYPHAISIEIMPAQVERASRHIAGACPESYRWEIRLADSSVALPEMLREDHFQLPETRVLWWLDAHFPERYVDDADRVPTSPVEPIDVGERLPLEAEVMALTGGTRDISRDVIVIDDWRVYAEIPNVAPLPHFLRSADGELPAPGAGTRILAAIPKSHDVHLDTRDGGYLICLPRGLPR